MKEGSDPVATLTQVNQFRQAKAEHYLLRAEEYLQMHRFFVARATLQKVLCIDPSSKAAGSLEKKIEVSFAELSRHAASPENVGSSQGADGHRHRRKELVMVVDQDERVLNALTERLKLEGFDVICAASYDEAIESLTAVRPDVVVSEVNFENGSVGFDLYLWIRTNNATSTTPFLFLVTKIDRDMLIAGKRLGVDDFIVKPLDEDVVTASIMQCLARHKKNAG